MVDPEETEHRMTNLHSKGLFGLACVLTVLASCGSDCDSFVQEAVTGTATDTFNINLRFDDDTPYDYEGVQVFIDGLLVGLTGEGGTYEHTFADTNVHEIRALHAQTSQGIVMHDAGSGSSSVFVPMTGDLGRPGRLFVEQVPAEYLPGSTTSTLDLALVGSSGVPVDMQSAVVVVRDSKAASFGVKNVTDLFEIDGPGSLTLLDTPALYDAIGEFVNAVVISVRAVDTDGARVAAAKNFFFGQHTLDLALEAPPSSLGLDVTDLEVSLRLVGTDSVFTATTDATGQVSLVDMPTGTFEILVETELDGEYYTAAYVYPIEGDSSLGLVVLGLQDVLSGVSVVATTSAASSSASNARYAGDAGLRTPSPLAGLSAGNGQGPEGTLQVSGGLENQVVVAFSEVLIDPGTETLGVTYEVVSEEYPEFVQLQEGKSDTWSVRVYSAQGKLLFSNAQTVNSQLRAFPTWIPGSNPGTTGLIDDEVDLAGVATEGSESIYLVITSTNIGDDLNPTSVFADIGQSRFLMRAVSVDAVTPDFECGIHSQTQGKRSDQFSLPYEGDFNSVQRKLTVDLIGRPEGVSINNVSVDVVEFGNGNIHARVVDEAPSAQGRVQHLVPEFGREQLVLTVTYDQTKPSMMPDKGVPPFDRFEYVVTITADEGIPLEGSQGSYQTEFSTPAFQAFWKANLDARTGCRESGGDDWSVRSTILWLNANLDVVPAVDDINGEHNRNLGHAEHETGKAINIRQFPSSVIDLPSGLKNYIALRDDVRQAFLGDAPALGRVDEWFQANRAGFAGIAAAGGVQRIFVAESPAGKVLPANWFYDLFTLGTISDGKVELDLPSGPWTHPYVGRLKAAGGLLDHYQLNLH